MINNIAIGGLVMGSIFGYLVRLIEEYLRDKVFGGESETGIKQ